MKPRIRDSKFDHCYDMSLMVGLDSRNQSQPIKLFTIDSLSLSRFQNPQSLVCILSHTHAQPSSSPAIATDVSALAFTGGSRYLATGGADRLVHVWDLQKRENIRNLTVRVQCAPQ